MSTVTVVIVGSVLFVSGIIIGIALAVSIISRMP